jgi:hypothetical protein
MIDDDGTLPARLQAEADAILRLVAPDECPAESPPLVLPFAAIGVDDALDERGILGFSAMGLDVYAAWRFDDPTLRGRPVFAFNAQRIADTASSEAEAMELAREVALHELAHSCIKPALDTVDDLDWFIARVVGSFTSSDYVAYSRPMHGPGWWRRFTTLVGRVLTVAPAIAPTRHYAASARVYGYDAVGPAEWLAASWMQPDYMVGPVVEVASRPAPWFDELLAHVSLSTAAAPAVAASPS